MHPRPHASSVSRRDTSGGSARGQQTNQSRGPKKSMVQAGPKRRRAKRRRKRDQGDHRLLPPMEKVLQQKLKVKIQVLRRLSPKAGEL